MAPSCLVRIAMEESYAASEGLPLDAELSFSIRNSSALKQKVTKVFELLRDGVLDGLRIDHIDGLLDPKGYLLRLRQKAPRPCYLVSIHKRRFFSAMSLNWHCWLG